MSNYLQALLSSFSSLIVGDFEHQDSTHPQLAPPEENPPRSPVNFFLIPAELIELIFDNCDSNDLHASSLVCRSWRTSTMHILFSKVALSPTTSSAFVEFLKSKSGEPVRGSVKILSLTTGSDFFHSSISNPTVESLSILLQPSSLKLAIYNNAGSKHVDGYLWWARQPKDLGVFRRSFKTVRNLELTIRCDTFIEVAETISSFPILETLTLSGAWLPVDQEDNDDDDDEASPEVHELPENHIVLPHTLHTIRLPTLCSSSTFLHWLCSHEQPPRISTLALGRISSLDWQLANVCLQELGETLQCLELEYLMLYDHQLELSCNTGLRKLTLHNPWSRSSETAFCMLSQVTSLSLEEFEFSVWDPRNDPRDRKFWPQLDTLLAKPQFSQLRRVTVNVNPATRHAVEARLPIMRSRNLVRFHNSTIVC